MAMQSTSGVLESYSRLKTILGNDQALELVTFLDARSAEEKENLEKDMVTKADLIELTNQFSKMNLDMTNQFSKMNLDMSAQFYKMNLDMANEFSKMNIEIRDVKVEMTRWLLATILGIVGLLIVLILAVLKIH